VRRSFITFLIVLLLVAICTIVSANQQSVAVTPDLASMPLAFTENQGQWPDSILYRADAGGATMWFTKDGIYYQFTRRFPVGQEPCAPDERQFSRAGLSSDFRPATGGACSLVAGPKREDGPALLQDRFDREPDSIETIMIKASFVGANSVPRIEGRQPMGYKCNYFISSDPSKWRTDVPNYRAIVYEDIYPGIDLRYSGAGNGQMTYEFIATPGADLSQIEIVYEGDVQTSLDSEGRLVVTTSWGSVLEAIMATDIDSGEASPRLYSSSESSFTVEAGDRTGGYGESRSLTLVYSTYLGGSDFDDGSDIAVDASGCAYVSGGTYSSNFPTQNAWDKTHNGGYDVFVTKFSSAGNSLVYSTYLGGSDSDKGYGIAVDASGCAYVTGGTESSDFPTQDPFQTDPGWGDDVFVTKFSAAGNSLVYSTYLGGSGTEEGWGISVDASGCAYVTGQTASSDFPMQNAWDDNDDSFYTVFVTKFSPAGNSLVYSTYLGGSSGEWGYGIAVDVSGCAYVTGITGSSDFPTQNAWDDSYNGGNDAFVTKFSPAGNSLAYSTFLGGGGFDCGIDIVVDASSCAYVTGLTTSLDFPIQNAWDDSFNGGDDAFVTKFSPVGNSLEYSTYLGGSDSDNGYGIAVDTSGCSYVTGRTWSSDLPHPERLG